MKHKLESRLQGEISLASGMQMTHPYERKKRGKNLLMKVKKKNEKAGLKFNIQKTKIMASGPITSWEIDGEKMETVTNFIFLGSKITAEGEIKRPLHLGRKAMIKLDSVLKHRHITFLPKIYLVKAMVFPVVMYECESWTVKKTESQKIDTFELWCWRRLLREPWTARRSNLSILKVCVGCSLNAEAETPVLWPPDAKS